MSHVTLTIERQDDPRGWHTAWQVDDKAVGTAIPLTGPAVDEVTNLGAQFLGWFEHTARPRKEPHELAAIGRQLYAHWFKPAWSAVQAITGGGPHELLIRSRERDILNVPWELVALADGLPISAETPDERQPRPGPLHRTPRSQTRHRRNDRVTRSLTGSVIGRHPDSADQT